MTHTPTPWVAVHQTGGNRFLIRSVGKAEVASLSYRLDNAAHDAAFIVKAVNSHDKLVEALRALIDASEAMGWSANAGTADAAIADARELLEAL